MQASVDLGKIIERLTTASPPESGFAELFRVLLCELVLGRPVSRKRLATALGWPARKVATALERAPGVECDDRGDIVGYGLTLRETPHAFELDGRRLYTWCALDALMFPPLIGKTARVLSSCAATGAPIRLTVAPDAVRDLEPPDAMVSLVQPDASPDLRNTFCCHVHFFASAAVAEKWAAARLKTTLVSVQEAFRLGQELSRRLAYPTLPSCSPSCT